MGMISGSWEAAGKATGALWGLATKVATGPVTLAKYALNNKNFLVRWGSRGVGVATAAGVGYAILKDSGEKPQAAPPEIDAANSQLQATDQMIQTMAMNNQAMAAKNAPIYDAANQIYAEQEQQAQAAQASSQPEMMSKELAANAPETFVQPDTINNYGIVAANDQSPEMQQA